MPTPPALCCPTCGVELSFVGGLCAGCLAGTAFGAMEEFLPSEEAAGPALAVLGPYEVAEEIGRGGMGVVYRARQASLDREVALKVISAGPLADPEFLARFRTEARLAGKLKHPHIVTIHDVGESEGHAYFSMDLLPGGTLAGQIREQGPMTSKVAATCVRKLCGALAHAHDAGVLHRDLKPSNILLDHEGEPLLADFGLAKSTQEVGLTLTNQALGTPAWQAPEQITASGEIDFRTDIYGMGAVLYYCVTGLPPFAGQSVPELLLQVPRQPPLAPRLVNPSISRDLETIILRCLEKAPSRRFGSATELAEELIRFESGRPIRSRPISLFTKAWRLARRHRALAASLLVLTLVVLGSSAAMAVLLRQAQRAATSESFQKSVAEAELWNSLLQSARGQRLTGDADTRSKVLGLVKRASQLRVTHEVRSEAIAALAMPEITRTGGFERGSFPIALHPRQALGCHGDEHAGLKIINLATGQLQRILNSPTPTAGSAFGYGFAEGGQYLYSLHSQATVLWQADSTGPSMPGPWQDQPVHGLSFSADGQRIAILHDLHLQVLELPSGRLISSKVFAVPQSSVHLSPSGRSVVVCEPSVPLGCQLTCFEVLGMQETMQKVSPLELTCLAWSTHEKWLACGWADSRLELWDADTGQLVSTFRGHESRATQLKFISNDQQLLSTSWDGTLRLWDLGTSQVVLVQAPSGNFSAPEGADTLYTTPAYGKVTQLRLTQPTVARQHLPAPSENLDSPFGVAVSANGRFCYTIGSKHLRMWDLQKDTVQEVAAGGVSVVVEPGGLALRTSGKIGVMRYVLDTATGMPGSPTLVGNAVYTNNMALAADGLTMAVSQDSLANRSGNRSWVDLWHRDKFLLAVDTRNHFPSLALDGKGTVVAVGGHQNCKLRCWDVLSGARKLLAESDADLLSESGLHVALNASGSRLASISPHQMSLWDLSTGRILARHDCGGPSSRLMGTFSPDGEILAAGGHRHELWLLSSQRGSPIAKLEVPNSQQPTSLSFREDGNMLVASLNSGGVLTWDLAQLRKELRSLGLDW